jgi:hypothetical protein
VPQQAREQIERDGMKLPSAGHALELLAAAAVGVVAFALLSSGGEAHLRSHVQPYEYLYLDSRRVDSYLGQLAQGNVRSLNRSETETNNATAGLQFDTIGSATTARGKAVTINTVVTKTEADNFYSLLERLQGDSLVTVDAEAPALSGELAPERAQVGSMVRIDNGVLTLPPYLSAYPELRYARFKASFGFTSPPLTQYKLARYTASVETREALSKFTKSIGPNPRLPLSMAVPKRFVYRRATRNAPKATTVVQPPITIVIPARFSYLTGDQSLLYAPLTIVGKVVFNGENFGDGASEDTYLPALLHANTKLLQQLGVAGGALDSKKTLFRALSESLTYRGRVIEVVPVAIYD